MDASSAAKGFLKKQSEKKRGEYSLPFCNFLILFSLLFLLKSFLAKRMRKKKKTLSVLSAHINSRIFISFIHLFYFVTYFTFNIQTENDKAVSDIT